MKNLMKVALLVILITVTTALVQAQSTSTCVCRDKTGECVKWKNGAETVVTSHQLILKKLQEYENEVKQLRNKKSLGLDVDRNKISLLDYKIDELEVLNRTVFGLVCNSCSLTFSGSLGLIDKYEHAKDALNSKTISQAEFTTAVSRIKAKNADLIKKYNIVVALTAEPDNERSELCDENLSQSGNNTGICSEIPSQNENTSQSSGNYNGAIKNVSDTIELGNQLKGLFGK